jgi:hypothetical protein
VSVSVSGEPVPVVPASVAVPVSSGPVPDVGSSVVDDDVLELEVVLGELVIVVEVPPVSVASPDSVPPGSSPQAG